MRTMKLATVCACVVLLTLSHVVPVAADADAKRVKVILQLKWLHAFQFAGYYAAAEKGYYREAGLDVDIVPAKPGMDPMQQVLQGRADFGVGTTKVIPLRAKGKPVVVLAVILQHSPAVFLANKTAGIKSVKDFKGKRVMMEPDTPDLLAYLKKEGVTPDDFTSVGHTFSTKEFIDDKVDVMSAYSTVEPFLLQEANKAFRVFSPRSAGIDFYGDLLFTTQEQIRGNPDQVRAFREASIRGWRYAMEHPSEIIDLIKSKYHVTATRPELVFEADRMAKLMSVDSVRIGSMSRKRWKSIAETYSQLGMIPKGFSLDGLLYGDLR